MLALKRRVGEKGNSRRSELSRWAIDGIIYFLQNTFFYFIIFLFYTSRRGKCRNEHLIYFNLLFIVSNLVWKRYSKAILHRLRFSLHQNLIRCQKLRSIICLYFIGFRNIFVLEKKNPMDITLKDCDSARCQNSQI